MADLKVDAALTIAKLEAVSTVAPEIEAQRIRRDLQLRRSARPVLPAAARGRVHRARPAHDRGRDRVRRGTR